MNFIFMNKNIEVLGFEYDEETHTIMSLNDVIHIEYAPLGIMEYKTGISRKALNNWWQERAIPASRSRLREVLDNMDIGSSVELLEKCFGLSLSDQYWIKEQGSQIQWKDINFFQNEYSDTMGELLMGHTEVHQGIDMCSPDNSSDGNLRKKWKIINGNRCLVKSGNTFNQEPFNEIIATRLYERILGKEDFVPYFLLEEDGVFYSCCETMVSIDEELTAAYYIDRTQNFRGSDSLYQHYIDACEKLGIPDVKVKINQMIVCDYILANYDRHYRNFGAIRDVETLKWKRIAPIFDSGSSLWATTPTPQLGAHYKSKPFQNDPEDQLKLVKDLSWLDETKLSDFHEEVKQILSRNPLCDKQRIKVIGSLVQHRIENVVKWKKEVEGRIKF